MATLSALLINILLGSFQLFLHSDQPLSEGEITRFSGTSREGWLSTPEAVVASRTDWQWLLWCATDDDQRQHHHAEHHFQLQHRPTPSCICIERSNTLTHLHVSNCRVRQLSVLWHFCRASFVGNGVITVISINVHSRRWCDNRFCIIAVIRPYINLSDRSARFFEFWVIRLPQPYARTDHNQRRKEAQILLQWSIAWSISPRSIIGKAPRSLICCNATASWLFGEKSFRPSCFAVGIPPTERSW